MLEALGSGRANGASDGARSGERYRADLGMLEHGRSGFCAKSSNNIHHAFWNSRIRQHSNQVES